MCVTLMVGFKGNFPLQDNKEFSYRTIFLAVGELELAELGQDRARNCKGGSRDQPSPRPLS